MNAHVIGAGLAGCEAAWQLAKRGHSVILHEMRPGKMTPAHTSDRFAELVCSNSLRSDALTNAVGLLKEEMRQLDSLIMKMADAHRVPAGSALAVDRIGFSQAVTDAIRQHPLITIVEEEVTALPDEPTIVASGPLTSKALEETLQARLGGKPFYFYDAAAPIVVKDSIDFSKAYYKSRYDKGDACYINCPMNREQFDAFYDALIEAKTAELHTFEQEVYFEGCMPFEVMAKRGRQTLLFGPMKPVGLEHDGIRPYAVVQLRQDDAADTLYNVVGFQTHLLWPEQKRILHMIPGLEQAEIVRYGVMHRNTYVCSPTILRPTYQTRDCDTLFLAGQLTGVEGYMESCGSGLVAGINLALLLENKEPIVFPRETMLGAMAHYITHASADSFQPMNANFGIVPLQYQGKKNERKAAYAKQSLPLVMSLRETL